MSRGGGELLDDLVLPIPSPAPADLTRLLVLLSLLPTVSHPLINLSLAFIHPTQYSSLENLSEESYYKETLAGKFGI